MAITYLSGQRVQGSSAAGVFDTCTGFDDAYDSGSTGDSNIRATKITATTTGNVTHLSCELENVVGNVIMALYDDDSGTPDALLGKTLSTTVVAGVNSVALIAPVSITSGIVYWIAFQNSATNNVKMTLSGVPAGTSYYSTNTPTMVIQDPIPSGDGGLLGRGYQLCLVSTGTDEKTTVTDVPLGSEFEQTNNYKTYQLGQTLVDGSDLKGYWRFNEASGNIDNVADEVTDNDTVGGVLTVNNGGDVDHIDYQESTATGNIPSVARWARTSASDGAYADASGASSLWNFLHYNSAHTDNQPKWSVVWWYNTGAVDNNTMFFTTTDNADVTNGLNIYESTSVGSPASWRIHISMSSGMVCLLEASAGYIATDDEWHMYSITYDGTLGSNNMKIRKDNANLEQVTKNVNLPNSGDARDPIAFQHNQATWETYIPPANNTAELSIWNRVLTDAELTTIYGSGDGFNLIDGTKVWVERGTAI